MERYAELTKERLLNIKCRVNETSVPRILRFLNADGSPRNISALGFEIPVKKQPGATRNIFKLTIGDGLTVQGDNDSELLIEVSATRATQTPNIYFWQLFSITEDGTWLNGDWEFFVGKYDGVESTETIYINESGVVVKITLDGAQLQSDIDGGSAASVYMDDQIIDGGNA